MSLIVQKYGGFIIGARVANYFYSAKLTVLLRTRAKPGFAPPAKPLQAAVYPLRVANRMVCEVKCCLPLNAALRLGSTAAKRIYL
ncbi:MAG: hypothetical protein HYU99_05400 [Deltaproteobacteria bacterium]|nr:hypothetical protein [Deltaproteobacteria bacterium]